MRAFSPASSTLADLRTAWAEPIMDRELHRGQTPLAAGVPAAQARAWCVFVHGRGQSPELMVGEVVSRLAAPHTHVLLPRAENNSWYGQPAIRPLKENEAELDMALDALERDLDALVASGAEPGRILLAGFSQGACLVSEFVLRRPRALGAVAILTGCRLGTAEDVRPVPRLAGLPVYLACGNRDGWIPIANFFETALAFAQAGAAVRADVFPDRAHSVSDAEIAGLSAMARTLEAGEVPA